jgi:translation initiation factor 3 subunit D
VIENFAVEGTGNVFATDAIIAQLMAASRSVYSWDIVIQKMNGMLFLDKRENSTFDLLSVSETAHEPPSTVGTGNDEEDINLPEKLSVEATMINQSFSQQVLKPDSEEGARKTYEANPFFEEEEDTDAEPASVAYRYRKFTLGSVELVVRCELHAWTLKRGEELTMTCHALNEWDSKFSGGTEWRQKIDQQRGAVLATELKNNSCKLGRWAAQSILAGADLMKLGYVSRKSRTNPYEHSILATQFFKPKDLAVQIAMTLNQMWGVIKMICDLMMKDDKEDGKYVLLKDPNKPIMRLYAVPPNTFESDEDTDDEDESGSEEDSDEDN